MLQQYKPTKADTQTYSTRYSIQQSIKKIVDDSGSYLHVKYLNEIIHILTTS